MTKLDSFKFGSLLSISNKKGLIRMDMKVKEEFIFLRKFEGIQSNDSFFLVWLSPDEIYNYRNFDRPDGRVFLPQYLDDALCGAWHNRTPGKIFDIEGLFEPLAFEDGECYNVLIECALVCVVTKAEDCDALLSFFPEAMLTNKELIFVYEVLES